MENLPASLAISSGLDHSTIVRKRGNCEDFRDTKCWWRYLCQLLSEDVQIYGLVKPHSQEVRGRGGGSKGVPHIELLSVSSGAHGMFA